MTEENKKDVVLLRGIGASSGIVIGKAHLIGPSGVETARYCHLDSAAVVAEIDRFRGALKESRDQLGQIKKKLSKEGRAKEHVRIIDAHLMILKDQMLIDDTIEVIKEKRVNAEWALKSVLKDIVDFFDRMDDEYLKERSADIEHIVNRVLVNLSGRKHVSVSEIDKPSIIVAHDLSPTDTAQMDKNKVYAFLTDIGGRTSHTAIVARSLKIPAVVGLEDVTLKVETGDTLVVDGMTGAVIINPSESVINVYQKRKQRYESYGKALHHYKDLPSETTDGHRIRLMGNMELTEEINSLLDHGAEGIGLYRSEFLYMNRKDFPTEEEHVAANPALGLRAIRLCLHRIDIFKTQLRGILRASSYGKIKILFPMISGVEELRRAKTVLESVKEELRTEKKPFNQDIELGVMIEVPSAALIADLLAKEVDFFSIGTNDLLQYSLAIDRVNEHVAYLYEPFHPAVLRIIKNVIDSAHSSGIPVGICGEMAGEPEHALIFLGMGLDQLSMNPFSLLRVKRLVRSTSFSEAREISEKALCYSTAMEVEGFVGSRLSRFYQDEFSS
jgi:phosphotransferase system enzyme I (PtsI)